MLPKRSYIIAATPRTGSYLLCEGLEATRIAGRPTEVFSPHIQADWSTRWSLSQGSSFEDYLQAAIQYGTTSNGVYGLKIHPMQLPSLAKQACREKDEVLRYLFPNAVFVNIIRRDRRAQALSYFRALATREWCRIEGVNNVQRTDKVPILNISKILELEKDLTQQQLYWEQYFQKYHIEPLIIEYETLAEDYRNQVAQVLAFLELDVSAAESIPPPRLVRQADDLTLHWRQLMETGPAQEVQNDEGAS